jgi:predicted GNAT family acetyltransferase
VVRLARENIGNYFIEGFEWLVDEIDLVQPCAALICENRIVSQCRSVRVSPKAHEAGLETLPAFRGRGYALLVTRFWAKAVREMGAVPLYSTSWKNTVSQRVAGKLKLYHYGNTFSAG